MEERKDVTVPMPRELDDAIKSELEYGDSKAGWIRGAIRLRLAGEFDDDDVVETDGGVRACAD